MDRSAQAVIRVGALALLCGLVLYSGCSESGESLQDQKNANDERIRRLEEQFHPSDYDRPPKATPLSIAPPESTVVDTSFPPVPLQTADQVPGYRVQIITTTSIDEAKEKKSLAESLFPGEWFYLQYDQPTYKIRAGNFVSRFEAERFRGMIAERGFAGAWVVPERVLKQPPPR
jgi:hypothetical protein